MNSTFREICVTVCDYVSVTNDGIILPKISNKWSNENVYKIPDVFESSILTDTRRKSSDEDTYETYRRWLLIICVH